MQPNQSYLRLKYLFSGDQGSFNSYIELFDNAALTEIQKMHCLRASLTGIATALIHSLEN